MSISRVARGALALSLALVSACEKEPAAATNSRHAALRADRRTIDPTTTHSLRGVVRLQGDAPARKPMSIEGQGGCRAHGDATQWTEDAIVRDGRVANVLVWVKSGHENWIVPDETDGVLALDQTGCMYRPRVSGMRLGAILRVRNSDPTNHNVNIRPLRNEGSNQVQSAGSPDVEWRPSKREVPVPIECNAHPWMHAFVGVFDHPWFAVTGDDGAFEMRGLPPGQYELEAWHEVFGRAGASATVRADADGATEIVLYATHG